MDKPNGGIRRGYSQGNGLETQQATSDRSQPGRQEEDWSMPTNVERRENETERHETLQAPPPNVPPPMEDRLFTGWSSIDSPRERVSQHNPSARSVEPNVTQSVNQTELPTVDPAGNEAMGNTLSDVTTVPSAHQQLSQVGTRFVDRETNTSGVEVRHQREETRTYIMYSHSRDVQMPSSHGGLSSHETDIIGGSPSRPCVTDIMPQLDGPTSVHIRKRPAQEFVQRTTTIPRGGYPDVSDSDSHNNMRPHDELRYSGRRRHYLERGGRPPDRGNDWERGYARRGRLPDDRGPHDDGGSPDDGGLPDEGGPPDDGGSPDNGGPPGNGRHPRQPGRQGPPGPPGPPGPVCPIIVQQPQVTLDTTALENTFDTIGQSMLQLARAQDQTNRHLQQHLQQGQINMQVYTGALQQLATSTYQ